MSTPIDPGEGWRLLASKEPSIEGDEARPTYPADPILADWYPVTNFGPQFRGYLYRRRIPQPQPLSGAVPTGIEAEVCADIARRQQVGCAKYGTTVADNPLSLRDWLQHAYLETLDNAIYLRRALAEIDTKNGGAR